MTRHEPVAASDTSGVTTQPTKRKMPLVVILMLAALAAIFIIGFATSPSQHDDRTGTPDYLCDLLRSGFTTSELASNDTWQNWSDNQSAIARGTAITAAADQGGCLNLT